MAGPSAKKLANLPDNQATLSGACAAAKAISAFDTACRALTYCCYAAEAHAADHVQHGQSPALFCEERPWWGPGGGQVFAVPGAGAQPARSLQVPHGCPAQLQVHCLSAPHPPEELQPQGNARRRHGVLSCELQICAGGLKVAKGPWIAKRCQDFPPALCPATDGDVTPAMLTLWALIRVQRLRSFIVASNECRTCCRHAAAHTHL